MKTPRILAAGIAGILALPITTNAVERIWTANPGNGIWNDPANWDANGVPVSGLGDTIYVHTPGSITGEALDASLLYTAVGTAVNPTSGYLFGAGTYNLGTLFVGEGHIGNGHQSVGPINNNFGRAFIGAGTTVNVGNFHLGEWDGASGHVIQSGGVVNISGQFRLGHWPQAGGATNSYTMNGGALTMTGPINNPLNEGAAGNFILGIDSAGTLIMNAGTFTAHGLTMQTRAPARPETRLQMNGGVLKIGVNGIVTNSPGSLGSYDINLGGGTVQATANWSSSLEMHLVSGGTGVQFDTVANNRTVTLSGNLDGAGSLTKIGSGTLKLSGNNSFSGGLTVSAGGVQLGDGGTSGSAGSGAVVITSPGSLAYNRTDALTVPGAVSGNGSLSVNSGTLRLANVSGSLNPSVSSGATLGASGSLGFVFANGGSTLEAGFGGVGNFTAGTLNLFGATLKVSAGTANTKFIAPTLNVSGTTNTIQVTPVNLTIGTYPLIDYSGSIGGGSVANFLLTGLSSRAIGGLVDNPTNTTIDLTISAIDFPKWNGNVDDLWDGGTPNWVLGIAGGPTSYQNLDAVLFNDDAVGTGMVNLTAAFTPSSALFNNLTKPYTLTGVGKISGDTGVTVQAGAANRVIVANTTANDYTGATLVQTGTLQVGDGASGSLGSDTTVTVATAGKLELNLAPASGYATPTNGTGVVRTIGVNSFTLNAGVLTGTPELNIGGDPAQVIGVNNQSAFDGLTTISSGTLRALGAQALGTAAGNTVITDGGTLDVNALDLGAEQVFISGNGTGGIGAIVNNGGGTVFNLHKVTLTADASVGGTGRWDIRTTGIAGELLNLAGHKLTKVGGNQVSMVNVNVTAGDIDINSGIFSIEDQSQALVGGTITLNSGGSLGLWVNKPGTLTRQIVANGGGIVELGSNGQTTVDAPISLLANMSYTVNGGNTVLVHNGNIVETGGPFFLNKEGPGRLILRGNNAWTGGFNVNAGVLQIGNGDTTGTLGSGVGTVNATLVFARTDSTTLSVPINPGAPAGTLIMVAGGEVTLGAGVDVKVSSLQFGVNGQDNTLGGILNIGPGRSLLVQDSFVVGNTLGGGATALGVITQTGGTVDVNAQNADAPGNADGRNFVLGHWGTGAGIYNLSAGTLNSPNISMAISWDGSGAFNLSGGTATVKGLRFGHNGAQSGIFELTGGTLVLGSEGIWAQNAGLPNDINLGGGTVRAGVTTVITEPTELTGTNGDVTFDTNGNGLVVSGIISGAGGFDKTGAGTLEIVASNTIGSTVDVLGGTVQFDASQTIGGGLNIANGAVVVLGVPPPPAPALFDDGGLAGNGVQAVPEPGALGLLAIGALGFFGRRKARREREES